MNNTSTQTTRARASVYDSDAFETRVNYAAACLVRGTTHGRHFFTCFEMWDGDHVVEALRRRAEKNPKLAAAWTKGLCIESKEQVRAELGHLSRRELADAARTVREERKARSEAARKVA